MATGIEVFRRASVVHTVSGSYFNSVVEPYFVLCVHSTGLDETPRIETGTTAQTVCIRPEIAMLIIGVLSTLSSSS